MHSKKLLKSLEILQPRYFPTLTCLTSCTLTEAIIKEVVNLWPGNCKLVNGRPRSLWVQGLVERTNACVEDMIVFTVPFRIKNGNQNSAFAYLLNDIIYFVISTENA